MTTTSGSRLVGTGPFEPLFVTLPAAPGDEMATPPPTAPPPTAPPPTAPPPTGPLPTGPRPGAGRRTFGRRHRVGLVVVAAMAVVVASGAGVFVYKWNHSNPQQLSSAAAYQQFRSGVTGKVVDPGTLHPAQGVYRYTGSAHESVSLPPKSQSEGPGMPGIVSYQPDGCWVWRLDDSDSHWQSSTFCPRRGNLVEVGRAGWYRWDFVALVVADTATFTCTPEVALPALLLVGQQFPFTCRGTNNPIRTAPVTMAGTNRYVGEQTLRVADSQVTTLHFREVSVFSGGQTGTNVADTWFSTANGLPVHGTWHTDVHSPMALGTSTLVGSGDFSLASSSPRS